MSMPQRKPKKPSVFNSPQVQKANWLGRYLEVEGKAGNEIHAVLEMAERSIVNALASIGPDGPISTGVRRAQLNLALQSVRKILRGTFGSVTDIIRSKQEQAAVAAVDAGIFDERGVMKLLFPNSVDRQNYADSLRETAQRNIQSTMTRVLKTEQPLSARVWRTNALSNGLVSKAVNNALARGESAENLAKEIRHLVRPDTPGGVSYAAMRLARTEINNAFHAQSIEDARKKPWVHQMRWNLSKVHKDDPGDECEEYAFQGLFDIDKVPNKPHPNCRCYVTAEVPDYQQFEDNLVQGHYDPYLDSVMGEDFSASRGQPDKPANAPVTQQYSADAKVNDITASVAMLDNDIVTFDKYDNVSDIAIVLNNQFGVDVDSDLGFNDTDMDLKVAKELANQFAVLQNKYPEIQIHQMSNEDLIDDSVFAITYPASGGGSTIHFNQKYMSSYADFAQAEYQGEIEVRYNKKGKAVVDKLDVGFHPAGAADAPAKSVLTHEWGHAIDNYIMGYGLDDWDSTQPILDLLWNDFRGVQTGFPELLDSDETVQWWTYLRKNLSGYSFEDKGHTTINRAEALAEAFDDVERNGEKALPGSKLLYQYLIGKRNEAIEEQKARLAYSASKRLGAQ